VEKNDVELLLGHTVAPRSRKIRGKIPQNADRELTKAKQPVDKAAPTPESIIRIGALTGAISCRGSS
jgi:hypothetical protein